MYHPKECNNIWADRRRVPIADKNEIGANTIHILDAMVLTLEEWIAVGGYRSYIEFSRLQKFVL
jgi:hypothetical protein